MKKNGVGAIRAPEPSFTVNVGQEISGITSREKGLLTHVDIELTKQCNLNCIHCSARQEESDEKKELTFREIAVFLREAKSLGLNSGGLTGGEPFRCRDKLTQVLEFCKNELNVPVHIHTNGILISDQDASTLCKNFNEISIGLFGSDPKTHDFVTRVQGSLKLTWEALARLQNAGTAVTIYIVPMKCNKNEIPLLINQIHRRGFRKIRILSLSPTGRARERFDELALNRDELNCLNKKIKKVQQEIDIELYAGFCTSQYFTVLRTLPGHDSCHAADNRIHINSIGDVFPCTASSEIPLFSAGNLRNKGCALTELWNNSPLFQFIRNFHSNPPNKCRQCGIHENCMSGCRVMMSYKYGDAAIADPQCTGPVHAPPSKSQQKPASSNA